MSTPVSSIALRYASGQPGADGVLTRRDLLRGAFAGAAALALGEVRAASVRARPNIVFIVADDLGYADVACYGRRDISTPNIDGLAHGGVRLLQAYSNSAVCTATRVALITGRYQYRLRLGLEEPLVNKPEIGLPPVHPTLPSLLRKVGYRTALVGKWHLGSLPLYGPLKSGYDQFYGFRGGAVDYYDHGKDLWDDDVPIERTGSLRQSLRRARCRLRQKRYRPCGNSRRPARRRPGPACPPHSRPDGRCRTIRPPPGR